jgi:hypothetical protein
MFTSKIGGTKELDEEIYNQIVQEKLITRASLWGRELKMFVISIFVFITVEYEESVICLQAERKDLAMSCG